MAARTEQPLAGVPMRQVVLLPLCQQAVCVVFMCSLRWQYHASVLKGGLFHLPPASKEQFPGAMEELILECTEFQAAKRPSIKDVLQVLGAIEEELLATAESDALPHDDAHNTDETDCS